MSSQRKQSEDLDGPWKEALEHFLEWFLALCFPEVHAGIDWLRGYQSLDKEFQQIVRDARVRKRLADKLFKVWRNDGTETLAARSRRSSGAAGEDFPGANVRFLKREQVRQLFRVLDWFMALPPELEQSFRTEFARFEEARGMPYVTSIERLAREEGRQEGVAEGFQRAILELLELKFKKVAAKHAQRFAPCARSSGSRPCYELRAKRTQSTKPSRRF